MYYLSIVLLHCHIYINLFKISILLNQYLLESPVRIGEGILYLSLKKTTCCLEVIAPNKHFNPPLASFVTNANT